MLVFRFSVLTSIISEVEKGHREVKKNYADTEISCKITGLDAKAGKVEWLDSTGKAVAGSNYNPDEGTFNSGTQISKLLVKKAAVLKDAAYTCRIIFGSLSSSAHSDTSVNLNVYGKIEYCILHEY